MEEQRLETGVWNLRQIVEWLALPPRLQLIKDGLDVSVELYRKLATRLASAHLGSVGLMLIEAGPDRYEVVLRPEAEWRDVAYHLGQAANLRAGRLVVNSEEELLRRDALSGQGRQWTDFRAAVLANLQLLAVAPEEGAEASPARAFRAALEAALEVEKVRRAA